MAEYLATPEALAAELGVPADDPVLLRSLAAATQRFQTAVGHPVWRVENDEILIDGDGSTVLVLPSPHVVAVHEVRVHEQVVDVEWSESGTLRYKGRFPDAWRAVRVRYDHGWDPIPDDVAAAVLEAAAASYRGTPGLQSMTVGGESLSFAREGVTQTWSDAVEAYKAGGAR